MIYICWQVLLSKILNKNKITNIFLTQMPDISYMTFIYFRKMNFNPPSKCQEVEEIRDVVTCAICLELFENAHLLACSHSFCMSCLRELCSEMGSMRTRCPQCRATSVPSLLSLDQLPENEFANKLADLVREQDDNLTSGCMYEFY